MSSSSSNAGMRMSTPLVNGISTVRSSPVNQTLLQIIHIRCILSGRLLAELCRRFYDQQD